MPKDYRRIAIAEFERKIKEHMIALGFIAEIPLKTVIHVIRPHYIITENAEGRRISFWVDAGYLLYPFKINPGSFRCRVLGIEVPGHTTDNLIKSEKTQRPCIDTLKHLDIRSWHPYRPEDAGLYMNWAVLTEEAKKLLYGK